MRASLRLALAARTVTEVILEATWVRAAVLLLSCTTVTVSRAAVRGATFTGNGLLTDTTRSTPLSFQVTAVPVGVAAVAPSAYYVPAPPPAPFRLWVVSL